MTQHGLEARIRRLEDIEEIKNLQARYCYFIDTLQMDKVPDLFAEKFMAEYVPLGTYTTKAILLKFLKATDEGTSMMSHQAMTPLIEGDGDKARGTWYLFGPFNNRAPEGEVANWIQGRYDNDYVREDGKWKFSHLRFKFNIQSPYEDGWVKTRMMRV